jgi:hypothetical protein
MIVGRLTSLVGSDLLHHFCDGVRVRAALIFWRFYLRFAVTAVLLCTGGGGGARLLAICVPRSNQPTAAL